MQRDTKVQQNGRMPDMLNRPANLPVAQQNLLPAAPQVQVPAVPDIGYLIAAVNQIFSPSSQVVQEVNRHHINKGCYFEMNESITYTEED